LPAKSLKVKITSQEFTFRHEIKKTIFPHIYDNENLLEDNNLKPVKLFSRETKTVSRKEKIQIPFELLIENSPADVFLYLNGQKLDMYYSIQSGRYSFNIYPKVGKNIVEIFYLVNGCKSPSVFNKIISK